MIFFLYTYHELCERVHSFLNYLISHVLKWFPRQLYFTILDKVGGVYGGWTTTNGRNTFVSIMRHLHACQRSQFEQNIFGVECVVLPDESFFRFIFFWHPCWSKGFKLGIFLMCNYEPALAFSECHNFVVLFLNSRKIIGIRIVIGQFFSLNRRWILILKPLVEVAITNSHFANGFSVLSMGVRHAVFNLAGNILLCRD